MKCKVVHSAVNVLNVPVGCKRVGNVEKSTNISLREKHYLELARQLCSAWTVSSAHETVRLGHIEGHSYQTMPVAHATTS